MKTIPDSQDQGTCNTFAMLAGSLVLLPYILSQVNMLSDAASYFLSFLLIYFIHFFEIFPHIYFFTFHIIDIYFLPLFFYRLCDVISRHRIYASSRL